MAGNNNQFLIERFTDSSKQQKLAILEKIVPAKDEMTLQFLITCLTNEYWPVRKKAAEKLKSYGEIIVPLLSGALNSYNNDVQHWSLQILSELGPKGYPAILRAMKSNNDEIRYFAAAALGKSRVPQGVSLLLKALGDKLWRIRRAASDALVKYGEAIITPLKQVLSTTTDEDVRFWTIKTLGHLGPKAQHLLLEELKTGDKKRRYVIAAALGESGDKRIIKLLIESLADPDWTIRKSATMALSEIGENAVEMMLDYIGGPNEDIRDGCLRALVKAGNNSLQKLFDSIIKMDENKRFLIRRSIVKIGNKIVEPIMRLFSSSNPEIQVFAASTMGEIGNPRTVPVLVSGLSSDNWTVRRSCAYALTEIGDRGVDIIAEALTSSNDDVRYWVTRILESIGEAGVPYLVKALKDQNKEIRFFAAKALGSSFDPSVCRALINALSDEIWGVRKSAAESLCKLENLPIEDLIRYISSDNEDIKYWIGQVIKRIGIKYYDRIAHAMIKGDAELRIFACQAAGIINDKKFTEPLIIALKDDSEWVRVYAAISLGQIGDFRAVNPLIESFSDRNREVHRNVIESFNRLGEKVIKELLRGTENDNPVMRSNSAKILAAMHEQRGIDNIIFLMDDSEESVRISATESLSAFPCSKTRSMLNRALKDSSMAIRKAAIKSIASMSTIEDIDTLIDHYESCSNDSEKKMTKRVMASTARDNPGIFIGLFSSGSTSEKNMALDALVNAGFDIVPYLNRVVAETDNAEIINWCNKAIKQIKMPHEGMYYV